MAAIAAASGGGQGCREPKVAAPRSGCLDGRARCRTLAARSTAVSSRYPRPHLLRSRALGLGVERPDRPLALAARLFVVADVTTLGFEMVASRILTPLFGGTIYTWATIISIVVGGLMAGYFVGGIFADRH